MTEQKVVDSHHFELMLILPPTMGDGELQSTVEHIKQQITSREGTITHEDIWGKRDLAYPIKHFDQGHYLVINFSLPPSKMSEFSKLLRLDTNLVRFLMTRTPLNYQPFVFKRDSVVPTTPAPRPISTGKPTRSRPAPVLEKKEVEPQGPAALDEVIAKTTLPTEPTPVPSESTAEKTEEKTKKTKDRLQELDEKLDQLLMGDL